MSSHLWYPTVKQAPLQGLNGLWGGVGSNLVGGGAAELWDWPIGDTYEFTELTATGSFGPTSTQINGSYSTLPFYNTTLDAQYGGWAFKALETVTSDTNARGIQRLVIPADGVYKFKAMGAAGGWSGSSNSQNGRGARIQTQGPLEMGDVVLIVCGQRGTNIGTNDGAGGGGGTFAYLENSNGWNRYDMTDIICAAGGGGGGNTTVTQSNSQTRAYADGIMANMSQGNYGITTGNGAVTTFNRPAPGYAGMQDMFSTNGRNFAGGAGGGFFGRCRFNMNDVTSGESFSFRAGESPTVFNGYQDDTFNSANNLNAGGSRYSGNSGKNEASPSCASDNFHWCYSAYPDQGNNQNVPGYAGAWVGGRAKSQGEGGYGGGGGGSDNCGGSGAGGGFSGGQGTGCNSISGGGGSYGRTSEATKGNFSGWTVTTFSQSTDSFNGDGELQITRIS